MADEKRSYYSIIPANIRYDENLKPNAKLLYSEITALTNEKGYCWASNQYFAELYKVSKNTISMWMSQLKQYQYITTEIIYKEGTKEIKDRYIRICGEGITKNDGTPITKKGEVNTKDINTKFNKEYIAEIIDYLNQKATTKYKSTSTKTQTLIKTRLAEGFTLEDFKKAITNKVTEWKGTDMEKYLRPETLFGTKFESYLNQKNKPKGKESQFNSYPQRDINFTELEKNLLGE